LRQSYLPLGFTYSSFILEHNVEDVYDELLLKSVILEKTPTIKLKEHKSVDEFINKEYDTISLNMNDFEIVLENINKVNNNKYLSTSKDPMIIMKGLGNVEANIFLVSCIVKSNNEDIAQLFWRENKEGFSPKKSLTKKIERGENTVEFLARSTSSIYELRIDPIASLDTFIVENISISSIKIKENQLEKIEDVQFEKKIDGAEYVNDYGVDSFKIKSLSIDPQIILSFPYKEMDSTLISVEFEIETDTVSICQIFWRDFKGVYFNEKMSKVIPYKKGVSYFKELIPSGKVSQIRIDPGAIIANYQIRNLKLSRVKKDNENDKLRQILKNDTLTITHIDGGNIKGHIQVDDNKILFLSIPFHSGWNIFINNSKVEPLIANYGFIGIPLEKGYNSVEFYFFPKSFKYGIFVSILTFFLILFFSNFLTVKKIVLKKMDNITK
jgi:hypothetical protein